MTRLTLEQKAKLARSIVRAKKKPRSGKKYPRKPPLDTSAQRARVAIDRQRDNQRTWNRFVAMGYQKAWEFVFGAPPDCPSLDLEQEVFRASLRLNPSVPDFAAMGEEASITELESLVREKIELEEAAARHRAWLAQHPNRRRALMVYARPEWVDRQELRDIYAECRALNREAGAAIYHVDHIVPICGKMVCGLHVPWNLRIIGAGANHRKSNRFATEEAGV